MQTYISKSSTLIICTKVYHALTTKHGNSFIFSNLNLLFSVVDSDTMQNLNTNVLFYRLTHVLMSDLVSVLFCSTCVSATFRRCGTAVCSRACAPSHTSVDLLLCPSSAPCRKFTLRSALHPSSSSSALNARSHTAT